MVAPRLRSLTVALALFACLLACAPTATADADATPAAAAAKPKPPMKDESLFSVDYGKLLLDDAKSVFTAPLHWDATDWITFGGATAIIVTTAAFADKPVEDFVRGNRNSTTHEVRRIFEPFGNYYPFAILAAYYGAGVVFKDPEAKAVALDGLSASLFTSGIISPALKYAVGRSRPNAHVGAHQFKPFSGRASFPSGHTTEAFTVASVIAEHSDKFWVKALAYSTATAVGYARMERNVHFLSDVMAGALIGQAVGSFIVHHNDEERKISIDPVVGEDMNGMAVTVKF